MDVALNCPDCEGKFRNRASLAQHRRYRHRHKESVVARSDDGAGKVRCPHCPALLAPDYLPLHIRKRHPGLDGGAAPPQAPVVISYDLTPEIEAMAAIGKVLEGLRSGPRTRVVAWLAAVLADGGGVGGLKPEARRAG